jgi:hypothetical protein
LQRADAALYAAKSQGRDRVVLDASAGMNATAWAAAQSPVEPAPDAAARAVPQQRRRAERRQRSAV